MFYCWGFGREGGGGGGEWGGGESLVGSSECLRF